MIQTAAQMAVLIDGDNLAPDFVERLLRKAETLGQVRLKRVYRDWTNAGDEWKALIRRENIRPAKSIACTGRKERQRYPADHRSHRYAGARRQGLLPVFRATAISRRWPAGCARAAQSSTASGRPRRPMR
ncbi:MAG: hypothetical protein WDN06_03270 [Asticcacaulis sp.]